MNKITHDLSLEQLPEYKVIERVIRNIEKSGLIQRFRGNCIGASDLIASMLRYEGIESHMVECLVSIKNDNTDPPLYNFIGYDGLIQNQNNVDVHVVLVTNTKVPLLIDLSLSHVLTETHPYVVAKANEGDAIGDYKFDKLHVQYVSKTTPKIPALHQKTILQKIKDEEVIREKLRTLQIFVWVIAGFALINFTLNITAVILKIIYL